MPTTTRYNQLMRLPVWAVFGAAAAGCSLIIPLDYVGGGAGNGGSGGTGAGHGGTMGGSTTQGGSSNGAEAGAGEGGFGEVGGGLVGGDSGSSGRGGSTQGGGGQGGSMGGVSGSEMGGTSMGAIGGSSPGGEAGAGAEGGTSNGGVSGSNAGSSGTAGAGRGGRGGASGGGQGGTAGAGMAGMGGCSFDLTSNPQHCGSCTNACAVGDECIDSKCVSSPCDELGCGSIQMADYPPEGPRKNSVSTTNDVCVEVPTYAPGPGKLPAINCWNTNGRKVEVNQVVVTCNGDQLMPMPKRKGGYCFHAFSGGAVDTGFVMPYSASGCCNAPTAGTGGT